MIRLLLLLTSYRQTGVVLLVDDVHVYAACIGALSRCRVDTIVVTLDSSCGYACLLECLDDTSSTLSCELVVEVYWTIDTSIAVYEYEGAWIVDDKVSNVAHSLATLCIEDVRVDLKEYATTELHVVA